MLLCQEHSRTRHADSQSHWILSFVQIPRLSASLDLVERRRPTNLTTSSRVPIMKNVTGKKNVTGIGKISDYNWRYRTPADAVAPFPVLVLSDSPAWGGQVIPTILANAAQILDVDERRSSRHVRSIRSASASSRGGAHSEARWPALKRRIRSVLACCPARANA